jgi:Amt family ammonium transporter
MKHVGNIQVLEFKHSWTTEVTYMGAINTGDTAWMLISTALVMLMTPGLAFFYGGMVRRKNALSTIMMSFMCLGLIGVLWVVYGYSLAFGPDVGGMIGDLSYLGLNGVGQTPSTVYATTVPQLSFMAYQMMFAVITVALITGAVVERMKFSSILVFAVAWFTVVYLPVAHWVWGSGGWLAKLGALDFAGGTVVHINAGVSALALAMLLGPRKGYKNGVSMGGHNIPFIVIGAGLLWFGWFGFNAGSALTAGGLAASAFVATNTAAAAAALTWMFLSWFYHRPTVSGIATGAVAGLVAITPAAGFVNPIMGIPIGIGVSVICFYMMRLRNKTRIDESLDVWACHGMGGTWGAIAAGIFASTALTVGGAGGLINGNLKQVGIQLLAVAVVWAFSFVMTWIIGKVIDLTMGLRVSETEENLGLDISQHGESAYGEEL